MRASYQFKVNRLPFSVACLGETNCQMCPAWQRIQRKYLAQARAESCYSVAEMHCWPMRLVCCTFSVCACACMHM